MLSLFLLPALLAQDVLGWPLEAGAHSFDRRASPACAQGQNRTVSAPRENIWRVLSQEETAGMDDFLAKFIDQYAKSLNRVSWNSTHPGNGTYSVNGTNEPYNYIKSDLEVLYPNKTASLSYLDDKGPTPPRMAQMAVEFNTVDRPFIQHFSVGPLPLSSGTTVEPINLSTIPGGKIFLERDKVESGLGSNLNLTKLLEQITTPMEDIVQDLVGKVGRLLILLADMF
jgi:hypothetical protein